MPVSKQDNPEPAGPQAAPTRLCPSHSPGPAPTRLARRAGVPSPSPLLPCFLLPWPTRRQSPLLVPQYRARPGGVPLPGSGPDPGPLQARLNFLTSESLPHYGPTTTRLGVPHPGGRARAQATRFSRLTGSGFRAQLRPSGTLVPPNSYMNPWTIWIPI